MIMEKERSAVSGILMVVLLLALVAATITVFVATVRGMPQSEVGGPLVTFLVLLTLEVLAFSGLFAVQTNQGAVLQLFGK